MLVPLLIPEEDRSSLSSLCPQTLPGAPHAPLVQNPLLTPHDTSPRLPATASPHLPCTLPPIWSPPGPVSARHPPPGTEVPSPAAGVQETAGGGVHPQASLRPQFPAGLLCTVSGLGLTGPLEDPTPSLELLGAVPRRRPALGARTLSPGVTQRCPQWETGQSRDSRHPEDRSCMPPKENDPPLPPRAPAWPVLC